MLVKIIFGIAKLWTFCLAGRLMIICHCRRRANHFKMCATQPFKEYASKLIWLVVLIQMCRNVLFSVWMRCYEAINVCKRDISQCFEQAWIFKNVSTNGPTNCSDQKMFYSTFQIKGFGNTTGTLALMFKRDNPLIQRSDKWVETWVSDAVQCIVCKFDRVVNCCNKTNICEAPHKFDWV